MTTGASEMTGASAGTGGSGSSAPATGVAYMTGKDLLLNPDGTTYHVGVKQGDIYPRMITVGCHRRANNFAQKLDVVEKVIKSSRNFHVYSGKYKGVGITIVAIGMGAPMMDFFVRECSYVCPEPMAVIRVGTCGLFNPNLKPGTVVVSSKGCACSYINHAAFTGGYITGQPATDPRHYLISAPVKGDAEMHKLLTEFLTKAGTTTHEGLNVAADTFFATQGRQDAHFEDFDNSNIMQEFARAGVDSCEMESFTLLQLATQRRVAPMKAASCQIGIVNRVNPAITENIGVDELHNSLDNCCIAALDTLINTKL